jgi:ketosteroid isomerase-like protein
MIRFVLAALALLAFASPLRAESARANVAALLEADRAFSAAAANAPNIPDAFAAMFDEEVVVPLPGRGHLIGRDAVMEAYRASTSFREGTISWSPIRGGISADGTQGFTLGYLDVSAGPPERRNRKYLAYWVRRPHGWRVVAYRLLPRPAGEVATAMLQPSLPGFSAVPSANAAHIESGRASLAAAEQAFSDRAQQVGLRVAFREFGRSDAVNMSEGPGFAIGLDAVVAHFPEGEATSPLRWSTERSFVASSGDLGVSIGTIHSNAPAVEGRPSSTPFFTVWRRDRPGAPWRYVAE